MTPSATPATQNQGECHQVPRLPRKVARRPGRPTATNGDQRRPSAPPSATRATPTTPNAGRCLQVPRLPRCHAKRRWMSPSATPASTNAGRRLQVPRLPRKTQVDATKCHTCQQRTTATKRSTKCNKCHSATPNAGRCLQVPHLPRKTQVDVTKCQACHVKFKRWWVTLCEKWCVTKLCVKDGV